MRFWSYLMSLVPTVVGTVAATNAADVGLSGHVLIYIAGAVLFGLISLVPLLGGEPTTKRRPPEWTVINPASAKTTSPDARISQQGLTIDGEMREIKEPPQLAGGDPRWGR